MNVDVLTGPIDGYISPKRYLAFLLELKAAELHIAPEAEHTKKRK